MTAARLSPAASLLRNSKLFGLPPTIALPPIEPSSEPVPRSNTATTIHPVRQAIETTYDSLYRGDWGLKRPLPLRSTTRSGTPVIRLNSGIDTAEHIADFDSAADHVLTLKKFQALNQSLSVPTGSPSANPRFMPKNIFEATFDNTANTKSLTSSDIRSTRVWPDSKPSKENDTASTALAQEEIERASEGLPRAAEVADIPASQPSLLRWRYDGPSLLQMSALEFDRYLDSLDSAKLAAFRSKVKDDLTLQRKAQADAAAREEGRVGEPDTQPVSVSDEDVETRIRALRHQPEVFGPLIVDLLDLPDGPSRPSDVLKTTQWRYGRETIASKMYTLTGPPRTHPSAGLSYIHSRHFVQNHPVFGPQHERLPSVARLIKIKTRAKKNEADYGLAGFVVQRPSLSYSHTPANAEAFNAAPDGQKTPVVPVVAEISTQGSLRLGTKTAQDWRVHEEQAVHYGLFLKDDHNAGQKNRQADRLNAQVRIGNPIVRSKDGSGYRKKNDVQEDQDIDDDLKRFTQELGSV